jgi:heme/copper-type cytochrome/quinol oxidase subunit 2
MMIIKAINAVDWFDKFAIYFSNPKSWIMWAIISLHDYMMFFLINILIVVLVFIFISFKIQKFFLNKLFIKKYVNMRIDEFNDAPLLEFFWTLLPAAILFAMAWPSFKLLFAIEQLIDPFHTVIIIGNQWYWTYQYSDFDVVSDMIIQLDSKDGKKYIKNFLNSQSLKNIVKNNKICESLEWNKYFNFYELLEFSGQHLRKYEEAKIIYDSVIIPDENLPLGYPRLLSVDQVLILPSNTSVRLLITSSDVIHSWALPSHGIKMDAIPGRINQVGFLTPFWGTYWGQCSELCGINHGFMPIEVRVLNIEDYVSYIKLNISYRYDKLIPILENCVKSFFLYNLDEIPLDKFSVNFEENISKIKYFTEVHGSLIKYSYPFIHPEWELYNLNNISEIKPIEDQTAENAPNEQSNSQSNDKRKEFIKAVIALISEGFTKEKFQKFVDHYPFSYQDFYFVNSKDLLKNKTDNTNE